MALESTAPACTAVDGKLEAMSSYRPLPPADINPWAQTVERDLDRNTRDISTLATNTAAAIQSSAAVADALAGFGAVADASLVSWSQDIGLPSSGWTSNANLPSVTVISPTGRLEVHLFASVRNGSARVCYSADNGTQPLIPRDTIRDNWASAMPITGVTGVYPASGYRIHLVGVPANVPISVAFQIYADSSGAVLSGCSLLVRPAL
jgi:hypothetical protein